VSRSYGRQGAACSIASMPVCCSLHTIHTDALVLQAVAMLLF